MKKIWERIVPLSRAGRSWDIKFWQSQSPTTRFIATWKMVEDFYRIRGKRINANSLRLQRSVENIKQVIKSKEKTKRNMDISDIRSLKYALKEKEGK